MLRENFIRLIPLNLLHLVSYIPLFIWCSLYLLQAESVIRHMEDTYLQQFLGTIYMMVLGMIPCILLTGPANAGIAYVTRNWARDESAMIWIDFCHSIKKNWKQAFQISAISALLPLVVYWYTAFLMTNPDVLSVSVIPAVLCGFILLLWILMVPTVYMMMVTYDLSFAALLKNGFIMTIAHLPTSVGIGLLRLVPAAVFVLVAAGISLPVGMILFVAYGLLWGSALQWLLCSAYANRLCEEHINPQIGAPVRIGLRKPN